MWVEASEQPQLSPVKRHLPRFYFFETGSLITSEPPRKPLVFISLEQKVTSVHSMAGDSGVGSTDPSQVFMLTGQNPLLMGPSPLLHGLKYVVKLVSCLLSRRLPESCCSFQQLILLLPLLTADLEFGFVSGRGAHVTAPPLSPKCRVSL